MMRENDKEAKSIIANTTNKMFMRMEELEATAKPAIDSGGQGFKAQMQGWSGKAGELNTAFHLGARFISQVASGDPARRLLLADFSKIYLSSEALFSITSTSRHSISCMARPAMPWISP